MKALTGLLVCAGLAVPAMAIDWDESIDGDLSNDEASPTFIDLDFGSNIISGTVGGPIGTSPPDDFFDAFFISVGAGETLDSIILMSYNTSGGNTSSGLNIALGVSWDGDFLAPNFLGSSLMTTAAVGTDLLDTIDFGGSLGPGDYVIAIREGTVGQSYALDLNLVPAPGATAILGIAGIICARRRR